MQKAKAAIILLSVLAVIFLLLSGGVFYLLQQERQHAAQLQEELDDIKAKQKITEEELRNYKTRALNLDSKLREANSAIEQLNLSLKQESGLREQVLYETQRLGADLEQQKSLRADLEKKLSQAQADLQKLQAQYKELSDKKTQLEERLKEISAKSQGVELGTIVVSSEGQQPALPREQAARIAPQALEGKILVINKEYNFIVINLGGKDGVKTGDVFSVYHANKYAGDAKVEKVHDSMSAAGFNVSEIKEKISEGDKVIQKIK